MTKETYEKAKLLVDKIFQVGATIMKVKDQLSYDNTAFLYTKRDILVTCRNSIIDDLEAKKEELEKEFLAL